MSNKKTIEQLHEELHHGLAEELLARLNSGACETSDLNVIRQFLKDNGITGPVVGADAQPTGLGKLAEILPFPKVANSNNHA